LVQGNQEVAVTEDCLPCAAFKDYCQEKFYGLQDFKRVFPISLDDDLRTHILNAAETCLVDYMPRIFDLGLEGIAIDARGKTRRYASEMTSIYSQAIEITEIGGDSLLRDLGRLKDDARARSLGGITSGHFLKGLKDELPDLG
jgi:U32 family peptidase